ncbi:MAG: rare lipoprotein [Polaromonas sp.]|nr:rare lipoprotein [Polaromonas sp.]
MARRVSAVRRGLQAWLAAGALLVQVGCAALPPSAPAALGDAAAAAQAPAPVALSASPLPQEFAAPTPLLAASAPVADPALALVMTPSLTLPAPPLPLKARLAEFIAKRLLKRDAAAPAAVEAEVPAVPQAQVDEKYRLTGEAALELERGRASWYGGQFHGRRTASGEHYDKYALTAAHKTLPFGTIVRVRSLTLGKEVDVRINDRGPFTPGRVIDVSQAAAQALGLIGVGVAEVSLNVADALDDVVPISGEERKARKKRRRAP